MLRHDHPHAERSWIRRAVRRLEAWARAPYVQKLAEWDMFPDDASREAAAKSIERGMTPRSFKGVVQFLIAVAVFLIVPLVVANLLCAVALPPMGAWNNRIMWLLTLGGYTAIVYVAIRRSMPRELRKRLLDAGVAVCLHCGYDLRGLGSDCARCPECGCELDGRVARLLDSFDASRARAEGSDRQATRIGGG